MQTVALIAAGGAAGALLRWFMGTAVQRAVGGPGPWGTLAVNLAGCLLIGIVWEWFESGSAPATLRPLLLVGALGAFTTFSTYGLETVNLARFDHGRLALANLVLSNAAGLACVVAGLGIGRLIWRSG